ncbi:MAG TPA: transglycosylase domain-containing protein [Nocardioides sp.]|nr:transglycosylase domain-containing protein [Nocardioides sp.]
MSGHRKNGTPPGGRKASAAAASRPRNGSRGPTGGKGKGAARRPLGRRIAKWVGLAALVGFLLGLAAFAYGYAATDIPDPNEDFQTQTTMVYYADGKTELGRFAEQNRTMVSLSDVPDHVENAVIAAEDRTFYTNQGIDPKGILRAAFSNARGNATQGASTITQQYVKVYYLSSDRTLTRKIKEAFLSLKLQRTTSKQEILQGYLNTIYFGRGAYGIQAAAQAYFDKDAKDLSVREGAALAAILNSPENYDPADGKDAEERLTNRYTYVLNGMAEEDMLPANDVEQAKQRLPKFPRIRQQDQYGGQRGHALALVKRELRANGFTDSEIEGGGLRVTTSFSRKAMNAARASVLENRPKGLRKLHVAVASVDNRTGALRGMFGGQDYLESQINWALAGGSPGSTFKPFALTAALKDGFSLKSTFEGNSPLVFPNGDDFENQGDTDYGSAVSLLKATEDSINTAYVDLVDTMDSGPQKVIDTAVDLGIPRKAPGLEPGVGVALGSATVSPIDMANAYGTIADNGVHKDWFVISKVTDGDGNELFKRSTKTDRAVTDEVARDVSFALQQTAKQGTAAPIQALGRPVAGKTGTSTDAKGNIAGSWFVGYTPQVTTAVMYSRGDGNDPLNGYLDPFFGSAYPAETWLGTMRRISEGMEVQQFPPPANLEATNSESEELPTFTPKPTPTTPPSRRPSPRPTPTEEPSPTQAPSPTQQPTPSPPGNGCPPLDPSCGTESPSPTGETQAAGNNGNGNGGG